MQSGVGVGVIFATSGAWGVSPVLVDVNYQPSVKETLLSQTDTILFYRCNKSIAETTCQSAFCNPKSKIQNPKWYHHCGWALISVSAARLSNGLEKKYPCPYSHFNDRSCINCSAVSTPSAITSTPSF